jgi:hypothetical protein
MLAFVRQRQMRHSAYIYAAIAFLFTTLFLLTSPTLATEDSNNSNSTNNTTEIQNQGRIPTSLN